MFIHFIFKPVTDTTFEHKFLIQRLHRITNFKTLVQTKIIKKIKKLNKNHSKIKENKNIFI